ncbi:YjdF family protein [Bacillus sp. APMAM]|nr:YjdF family protein [Bacillus sp. APMAM]RTZ54716.1 DUF2992 family protein [Bacillus sp. SAJ1]
MKLTVYFDGQFWIGVIEIQENKRLKAFRFVFGAEPSDVEILEFIHSRLLPIIQNSKIAGVKASRMMKKEINPKRIQRQVAKEMKKKGISSKAQEAIKEDIKQRKVDVKKLKKQQKDAFQQKKWELKKQKAKQKHKGR